MPFGVEVMGRVRELGTAEDVFAIAAQLRWVRPVIDFAHLHAVTDGGVHRRRRRSRRAEGRRRDPRAGRAVPHPLQRHPVREPERDEAPALRRGHAAGGAARRGAREVQAAGDGDLRVAGRGSSVDQAILGSDPARGEARAAEPAGASRGEARARRSPCRRAGLRPSRPAASREELRRARDTRSQPLRGRGSRSTRRARAPRAAAPPPPSSRPCAARTRPSVIAVVARELRSCSPTVSIASSAMRSASSMRPLPDQHLGEAALALAERAAVLERLEHADRLAEPALRLGVVALLLGRPRERVQRPPDASRRRRPR